jgi:hypothetical protein
MLRASVSLLSLLLITACTDADSDVDPTPAPIDEDVCAEQHLDGAMIVCTRAFVDDPRVHLPADTLGEDGAPVVVYAAATPGRLHLRDGREVAMFDHEGEIVFPVAIDTDVKAPRVPAGFTWPSYEFARTIYEVRGTWREAPGDTMAAIVNPVVVPVVRLAPEVLDGAMTGSWEGTMSKRTGENTYDPNVRIPVRIRWTGYAAEHSKLPTWSPYDPSDVTLDDILPALGVIENATSPVALASGECAPSLASLGEGSPIFGDDAQVEMLRIVAMHVPGDYQLSFEGGMGSMMPAHPAAFLQTAPRAPYTTITNSPHGAPNGMHLEDFRAVAGGGSACTP